MQYTNSQFYSVNNQNYQNMYQYNYIDTQPDNVAYVKPELKKTMYKYQVINDCMAGEPTIKSRREFYLRKPDPTNPNIQENALRYNDLLQGAIFVNFISPTVLGLKGQCFVYPPSINVPDRLKPLIKNVNGSYGIHQLSENIMTQTLSLNRGGLFTDFMQAKPGMSRAEQEKVMPSIFSYNAEQIINWEENLYDGKIVKSKVVLCEIYNTGKGKFKPAFEEQFRVLGLDENNEYYVEVWRENEEEADDVYSVFGGRIYPLDGLGNRWNEIPFTFLSSNGDSACIVEPPMYDLASINIGHYRNSASYEDSCNMMGEPTLVIDGLPAKWLEKELGGKVRMGSRGGIPLPQGAKAYLLQVAPNTMVHEAMLHKENQLVALGAKMLTPSNVVKTATESVMDNSEQNSILMSNSKNNSLAITKHLGYCDKYLTGSIDEEIEFKLLTETALTSMNPNEEMQTVASWLAGATTDAEMRRQFKNAGKAFDDKWVKPAVVVQPMGGSVSPSGTTNGKTGADFVGNKNN